MARPGSATAASSSRTSRSTRCRDARPLEQVGGIFQHARNAGRRAVSGALLGERKRQVELGAGDRHRLEEVRSPGSSRLTGALFWNASITWNSG